MHLVESQKKFDHVNALLVYGYQIAGAQLKTILCRERRAGGVV